MLQVNSISFSYLESTIISSLSFTLEKGKTLAVIGESGCGKSTLLKLIYGLYDLNEGQIIWGEQEVLGPKFHLIPGMEYMKYLAQDFDLMPFITVSENIGKYLSNFYPEQKKERIQELLRIVEMEEYAHVKAKYLSGGQMQRVAIARVLALEPQLLLLDEPFSHIDNFRKNSLRRKLFAYLNEKGITTIIATHDSTDVLSFAHDVIVMKEGTILEQNDPVTLYQNPQIRYTASLFGDVNEVIWEGKTILVYPHQLKVVSQSGLKATVVFSYFRGSHYLIEAVFESQSVFFESETAHEKGDEVFLSFT